MENKTEPIFDVAPNARADLSPGTLYAVSGERKWIYYGQVAFDKSVGFYKKRTQELVQPGEVLDSPLMAVMIVEHPSIGRAVRSGTWKKLGKRPLPKQLTCLREAVQWPAGTLKVTVWLGSVPKYETRVDDPAIQGLEQLGFWDAEYHIPKRLTADYGAEAAEWHVGGPIWRARRVKEEYARRFPEAPWHKLPADWVPTEVC